MITIYGMSNCLWCLKAKQMAELFELEYEYKTLSTIEAKKEYFARGGTHEGLPQVYWDGEMIVGYNNFTAKINEYIEKVKND